MTFEILPPSIIGDSLSQISAKEKQEKEAEILRRQREEACLELRDRVEMVLKKKGLSTKESPVLSDQVPFRATTFVPGIIRRDDGEEMEIGLRLRDSVKFWGEEEYVVDGYVIEAKLPDKETPTELFRISVTNGDTTKWDGSRASLSEIGEVRIAIGFIDHFSHPQPTIGNHT